MKILTTLRDILDHARSLRSQSEGYQLDVVVDVTKHVAEAADGDHLAEPSVDADALVCAPRQPPHVRPTAWGASWVITSNADITHLPVMPADDSFYLASGSALCHT